MVAVARAHRWEEPLESGGYGSWVEIAAARGCDPSYVARLLRLTLLAPDTVEFAMEGAEPDGVSLASSIGCLWTGRSRGGRLILVRSGR
jgi:hypothetical protein